jgi:arylsulfatase A-like enzyme
MRFQDAFQRPSDMILRTLYGRELQTYFLIPFVGIEDYPGRPSAADNVRVMRNWIQQDDSAPFFAFANFIDVHDPYLPPPAYRGRFSKPNVWAGRVNTFLSEKTPKLKAEELQAEVDKYDEALASVDEQIGLFVDELRTRRGGRPTTVIVTSDHGEFFGEHGGLIRHGNDLYREGIRVPFIVWMPGTIPAGVRVRQPVTIAATAATVMALTGDRGAPMFPGLNLAQLWQQPRTQPTPFILSEISKQPTEPGPLPPGSAYREALKSVIDGRWHYVWHESGGEELFDLEHDPAERTNVASTPEGQIALAPLKRQVDAVRTKPALVSRAAVR